MSDWGLFQRSKSPDNADNILIDQIRAASPREPNRWPDYTAMSDFANTLKHGHEIINLYIGPHQDDCYRIQANVLTEASPGFHERIAAFKAKYRGSPVTLHFANDDPFAWDVLLYWIFHRGLPCFHNYDHTTLLRAWILGETFQIPLFQDICMLELLRQRDLIPLHLLHEVFAAAPERSPMRQFLAEHVVFALHEAHGQDRYDLDDEDQVRPDNLEGFGQVRGAMVAVMKAQDLYRKKGAGMFDRFGEHDHDPRWAEFMVARGPGQHWIHVRGVGWFPRQDGEDDDSEMG